MEKLAIVGTGIAGLGCAHFLQRNFELTLFEQADYAGGHTNTVTIPEPGTRRPLPIDTGFMVFNQVTYPLLTRLFAELHVPIKPTAMSFSVRHAGSGLEFAGSSLNHLFAQRRNLFRPRFYRMLAAVNRFNAEAIAALDDPAVQRETLGDYVRRRGYGEDFFNLYLVPMSSAVWSTPPDLMLAFPAVTLLRFFHNHGFLGLHTQHQWWTVEGGARTYVEKITAPFRDRLHLRQAATRVVRTPRGVTVMTATGDAHMFSRVILACHADQALRLLVNPTADESRLLGEFKYQPNTATLHTDRTVMPRRRLAWSSWNYEIATDEAGRHSPPPTTG
jgi:predicted NAD/FAD-binding protein